MRFRFRSLKPVSRHKNANTSFENVDGRRLQFRLLVVIPLVCSIFALGVGLATLLATEPLAERAAPSSVHVQQTLWAMALAVLIAAAGALLAGALIARDVTVSLRRIADQTVKIARGDLSSRVAGSAGGEIGRLADSVNEAAFSLNRFFLEGGAAAIVDFDSKGRTLSFNDGASRLFAFKDFDPMGKTFWDWPLNWERNEPLFQLLDGAAMGRESAAPVEFELFSASGDCRKAAATCSVLKDAKGRPRGFRLKFQRSVSLVEYYEREMQASRWSFLNRLAHGLAHNVRNPLCSISGFAQLMRERKRDDPETAACVGSILKEVESINRLLESLIDDFSRAGVNPGSRELHALLDELEEKAKSGGPETGKEEMPEERTANAKGRAEE